MISKIKILFKKVLLKSGYTLVSTKKSNLIIPNVFTTSHSKTALLSYSKFVFLNPQNKNDRRHTNRYTTFLIAETLNDLGYNVDVIDCGEDFNGDFSKYSLVIGLGKALDFVIENRENNLTTKVIWFGTGCNPLFSNVVTLKRVADFYKNTNKLVLASSRYIKEDWPLQHEFSDWIILHGSTFAKATYQTKNISSIHAPVFISHSVARTNEERSAAKQHYLWFGVGGLIHKGLDLTIDAFKALPNCHLHICGDLEVEKAFYSHYKPIIDSSANITHHGFVDVASESFKTILKGCVFVVFPSASEGNSPSVLTCMANGGLIPIVTKNADIDLSGYGICIEDLNVNAVKKAVEQSQVLSIEDIKSQSNKIVEETARVNSFEYFKGDFKQKLQEAIKSI